MGITTSLILITAGAVMRFAVTAQASSFNVHTVGIILMIVGIVGALLSLAFWASWGGFRRRTVVETGSPRVVTTTDETIVR
jgi:beta-lactamase regulating signal transducer with metallopeptidase domain